MTVFGAQMLYFRVFCATDKSENMKVLQASLSCKTLHAAALGPQGTTLVCGFPLAFLEAHPVFVYSRTSSETFVGWFSSIIFFGGGWVWCDVNLTAMEVDCQINFHLAEAIDSNLQSHLTFSDFNLL